MKKDITFLIPSMNGGGAEKVNMLLANELVERGWAVEILMSKLEGPYLAKLDSRVKITVLKRRRISSNILEIARYLKNQKPTVLYSSMMYVNVVAGIASKISSYKGKLIYSEHSHVSTIFIKNATVIRRMILSLSKWLYRSADAVVCVSEGVKDDLISVISGIRRVIVVNNPVENLYLPQIVKEESKYKIISIGRLDRDKNFKLLIETFYEVLKIVDSEKIYELHILGEGYERPNLENLIEKLGISQSVFLHGFVESPQNLLNSSDLFVFTSLREGFGNVLVEALSCGLPVISTDCKSGPSEILKSGKLGKLIPLDKLDSLKDAILEEIRHPNNISTVEERKARAEAFSIQNITNQYERIFS